MVLRLRFLLILDPAGDVANYFFANVLLDAVFLLCLHDIPVYGRHKGVVQPGVQAEGYMIFACQ